MNKQALATLLILPALALSILALPTARIPSRSIHLIPHRAQLLLHCPRIRHRKRRYRPYLPLLSCRPLHPLLHLARLRKHRRLWLSLRSEKGSVFRSWPL